jgi:hypothetical protein
VWRHSALGLFPFVVVATCASAELDAQSRGVSVGECVSKAVDAPVLKSARLHSNSYALVVGIDNYDRWTDLSNAGRDGDKVATALSRKGFSIQSRRDQTGMPCLIRQIL